MTKFISIVSGKGGVGKTTTAINLAAALSSCGKEVLVVDGNVATPDIGIHLGTTKFPCTLHDALQGKKTLADAVYIHSSGLKFIPASISLDEIKKVDIGRLPEIMPDLYGTADIVIIDGAAGIGKEALSVVKSSDEAIIVTTPDIPSVTDALKMARTVKENGIKIYGIIVTRVVENNDVSPENISAIFDAPVIAAIPEDPLIKKALSMKQPVVFSHPETESSIAYRKLAAEMLGQSYVPKLNNKGFFARLFS
jgi:septum site-determining protein MinD